MTFKAGFTQTAFADSNFDGAIMNFLRRQAGLGEKESGILVTRLNRLNGLNQLARPAQGATAARSTSGDRAALPVNSKWVT